MAVIFTEAWTGSDADPWNGTRWPTIATAGGTGSGLIQTNRGRLLATAGAYAFTKAESNLGATPSLDLTMTWAAVGSGEQYFEWFFRVGTYAAGNGVPGDCYGVEVDPSSDTVGLFTADSTGAATYLTTFTTAGVTGTTRYNLRIQAIGSAIKAKWWTGSEPGTWQIEETDSSFTTGEVTLGIYNGADSASKSVDFDDLSIDDTAGGGAQGVTLPAIASTSTLATPTITRGAVTVALPAIASTGVLHVPIVSAGGTTIALPTIASTAAIHAPTVTTGAVAIALPHIASTSSLHVPTVSHAAALHTFLDDFERPNGPLGANWLTPTGPDNPEVDSGEVIATAMSPNPGGLNPDIGWAIWHNAFGADQEMSATVTYASENSGVEVYTRATDDTRATTYGAYVFFHLGLVGAAIFRYDNAPDVYIEIVPDQAITDPGFPFTMRLTSIGDEHTLYINDVEILQGTDSTITAGGYVGFQPAYFEVDSPRVEQVGGGDIGALEQHLLPPHIASTSSLATPAITTTTSVVLPMIASAATLQPPAITVGAVTIVLPAIASTTALYGPVVLAAGTNIALPHIAATSTLHTVTITVGNVTITLPRIESLTVLYPPRIGDYGDPSASRTWSVRADDRALAIIHDRTIVLHSSARVAIGDIP